MGTIIYILLALLLLGIMVTVHELGHFCAARACGIAVRAFGVGFGPKASELDRQKERHGVFTAARSLRRLLRFLWRGRRAGQG